MHALVDIFASLLVSPPLVPAPLHSYVNDRARVLTKFEDNHTWWSVAKEKVASSGVSETLLEQSLLARTFPANRRLHSYLLIKNRLDWALVRYNSALTATQEPELHKSMLLLLARAWSYKVHGSTSILELHTIVKAGYTYGLHHKETANFQLAGHGAVSPCTHSSRRYDWLFFFLNEVFVP